MKIFFAPIIYILVFFTIPPWPDFHEFYDKDDDVKKQIIESQNDQ